MRDAQREHAWPGHLGGLQPIKPRGDFRTLDGAKLLVWGFGSIAARLAPLLTALGAEVEGVARSSGTRHGYPVHAEEDLGGLLPHCDALVMILPSTPSTRHALEAERLSRLPAHAWLVNVGRGDTVDERALVEALQEGHIAGAALDVFEEEPLPESSPLWEMSNVIISPHAAGGRPVGAAGLILRNLERLRSEQPLENVVDRQRGY
jgi:phosphoglycerate dehydrogenase-like enzyme